MSILVNNKKISDEDIYAEMQYHTASNLDEAKYKASLALTIRELLLNEAKVLGIEVKGEIQDLELMEEYLINEVLEKQVVYSDPSEHDCLHYYNNHQKLFMDKENNGISFEIVKGSIMEYLQEVTWQTASIKYLKTLSSKAKIINILQ